MTWETDMQYLLAIYEDHAVYQDGHDGQAWQAIIEAHTAYGEALAQAGVIRGGEGLENPETAKTVRTVKGQTSIHDGPYTEQQEQLGGFYIIEVETMEEALDWAAKIPLSGDGSVEVRACLAMPDE